MSGQCPRCDLGAPNVCVCLSRCGHDDCAGEPLADVIAIDGMTAPGPDHPASIALNQREEST